MRSTSSVCARSLTTSNYYSNVHRSFSNVVPMPTKPNPQILHPAINCSNFFFSFQSLPGNHAITATRFLKGGLCVMIEGKALRVQINFSIHPFHSAAKVYSWGTYQSLTCLILFLHLCIKRFTLFPSGADLSLLGRWGKSRGQLLGLSGTEASWENSVKLNRKRLSWGFSAFRCASACVRGLCVYELYMGEICRDYLLEITNVSMSGKRAEMLWNERFKKMWIEGVWPLMNTIVKKIKPKSA